MQNYQTIQLQPIGKYATGIFDEGAAEIVAHDSDSQRLFVVNGGTDRIDVLDISDPSNITKVFDIDITVYGGAANSVAVKNGIVAVAVQNEDDLSPGQVVFFDADGQLLNQVEVGVLPDMLTFNADGTKILVANEGEPTEEGDPDGSVSIIDLSMGIDNLTQEDVTTLDFQAFNGREEEFTAKGLHLFPGKTIAEDVEPEYIAISSDQTTAFVTLQENNAFAVVDLDNPSILDIVPLGFKNHSQGQPTLEQFEFTNLPLLGTTEAGQEILLGGFSGLSYRGIDPETGKLQFITVSDRGPNGEPTDVDGDGEDERPFALPDYQARITAFELNPKSGKITLTDTVLLTQEDGTTPITGLPNIPDVDEEPVDLLGNPLAYDALGADLEGIVVTPNGDFWLVDEYRPAIYQFNGDGVLQNRFVPEGTAALAGEAVGTFGTETLPEEYITRRSNRGFEAVALDSDTGILYAWIQTPLANPDRQTSDNSDTIRILGIDPTTGTPVAEYVYLLEDPSYPGDERVDKIGDAVYAGNGKFYVAERDSAVGETGKKYIFEIDLKGAINLLGEDAPELPSGSTLEQLTPDELIDLGIMPVEKIKVTNPPSLGYIAGDKLEGLALLDDGRLAILNDNDFGLLPEEIPGDGSAPLNPNPTPITLGIIELGDNNSLDPSDEDSGINIQNWPVFGLYQPDGVASFTIGEQTYYLTANEGDGRDGNTARFEDLTLDSTAFPDAATLQLPENLGRLEVTTSLGDVDGDGDYDNLYSYGARSFSVWDSAGNLVFDSGNALETITAKRYPNGFNSNGQNDSFDSRSDNKGPEAEGVAVGVIDGDTYGFIGLERIGGIMVYNLNNPHAPEFVQYINTGKFAGDAEAGTAGDVGPEGLTFIPAEDSPTNNPLLAVGYEVSGTTRIFEIVDVNVTKGKGSDDKLTGSAIKDKLFGYQGDDTLNGKAGDDLLKGGEGNDLLNGGKGDDRLFGGAGADLFVLASNTGADKIKDFQDGEDQLLLIGGLTFDDLSISQGKNGTIIALTNNDQTLATLVGVDSTLITSVDFVS